MGIFDFVRGCYPHGCTFYQKAFCPSSLHLSKKVSGLFSREKVGLVFVHVWENKPDTFSDTFSLK
jgi:hypothetical protein